MFITLFSSIFESSDFREFLEQEFDPDTPYFVIGDAGFAVSTVMIPPFRQNQLNDPLTQEERMRLNVPHQSQRLTVEQAIGHLKVV